MVIPEVMTVTGAVGIGILGGAIGFAWGTIDAVAAQLIETCTRNLTLYNPNCAGELQQFLLCLQSFASVFCKGCCFKLLQYL